MTDHQGFYAKKGHAEAGKTRVDQENTAKSQASAAINQASTDRFTRDNYNIGPQPPPIHPQPPIIRGDPSPSRPSRPSKPTASSGSKALFGIAALVALLTALGFYALPQIHNYFGGYTGNSYIAVVVVASLNRFGR